jgi:hypothetical protein
LREGYSDAFLEQCRRMVCGGKDTTLNYELFNEPEIVKYIKINRLGWAGHVIHMDNNRTVKKAFNTKPIGIRNIVRPNLRWEDDVIQDIKTRSEKLEGHSNGKGKLSEASDEGQGPCRAVEPMMMIEFLLLRF